MAFSKVTLFGETLMDTTGNTVTSSTLFQNRFATGADGEQIEGEYVPPTKTSDFINDGADGEHPYVSTAGAGVEYATPAQVQVLTGPLVASAVEEMTDTDKVYVYIGEETGYTAGDWYYYDGSDWVDGGVYNSIAVQTDTTLSVSGMAADAAATGNVQKGLDVVSPVPALTWNLGKNIDSTGAYANNQYMALTDSIPCRGGECIVRRVPAKDGDGNSLIMYVSQFNGSTFISRTQLRGVESVVIGNTATSFHIAMGRAGATGVQIQQSDIDTYFDAGFYTEKLSYSDFLDYKNLPITFAGRVTNSTGYSSFAAISEPNTYWAIQGSFKDVCTDWPPTMYTGEPGTLFNLYAPTITYTTKRQYIVFQSGIYYRSYSVQTSSWTDWAVLEKDYIVPAYWDNAIRAVTDEANLRTVTIDNTEYTVNSGLSGDRLIFITDTHWTYGAGHSPAVIHELMKHIGKVKIFCGGDIMDGKFSNIEGGESATDEEKLNRQLYYKRFTARTKAEMEQYDPMYYCIGNHEYFNPDQVEAFIPWQLTADEAYKYVVASMNEKILGYSAYGDYYFDNVSAKIRYIFISSDAASYINENTPAWLEDVLEEMPADYTAILISHVALNAILENGESKNYLNNFKDVMDVLDAAKEDGINIGFVLSGHNHMDRHKYSEGGILTISTATDAWKKTRVLDENNEVTDETKSGCNEMEPGTDTEHCFDVVSFDLDNRVVVLTRVGAGSSRAFTF